MTKHTEHRLGVSEANLVKRHLPLIQPVDNNSIKACLEEINQLYGLDDISYDADSATLHFSYDASRLCIDCVEDILTKHNIELEHGWWTHFKEEYYRFVDQNIKDNAEHEPWSCHNAPRHTRNK